MTLDRAFESRARNFPSHIAMRRKESGLWSEITWAESEQIVVEVAVGMASMGVGHGDTVFLVGDVDCEMYWAAYATWYLGGIIVGGFADATPDELRVAAIHSDAVVAVVRDQEQVDKFLEILDSCPGLQSIIWWDERGLWDYTDDRLADFRSVRQLGASRLANVQQGSNDIQLHPASPEDVAAFYFTSGTTGQPKAVMHSHASLITAVEAFLDEFPVAEGDDHVAGFPMATPGEPFVGSVSHVLSGLRLNFVENADTAGRDAREVSPVYIWALPRAWEQMLSEIDAALQTAAWVNRKVFAWSVRVAERTLRSEGAGLTPTVAQRILVGIADLLVLRWIRDQLGVSRTRYAITAGYVLGEASIERIRAIGIPLVRMYGGAEMLMTFLARDISAKSNTIGAPLTGVEARINEDGELEVRWGGNFVGYYKDRGASDAAVTDDGWYRTGDVVQRDREGDYRFIDRISDVCTLPGGVQYSPQHVEAELRYSVFVRDAMCIGDLPHRPFMTAVVAIAFERVGKWAEEHGVAYTTERNLAQRPEVGALLAEEIAKVNERLLRDVEITRFVIMPKALDADEGELTRTSKLKREHVEDRYAPAIEAMYEGGTEAQIEFIVKFQGGTEKRTTTTLPIWEVAPSPDKSVETTATV